MSAVVRLERAEQGVLEYIEDMLAELAAMAEGVGERKLGAGMRRLAIEAARAGADAED